MSGIYLKQYADKFKSRKEAKIGMILYFLGVLFVILIYVNAYFSVLSIILFVISAYYLSKAHEKNMIEYDPK